MKLALVGDIHLDEHSRFEECVRILAWIAADAAARGVRATLCSGDVYERKSTPREREEAAVWVQAMAELGPVVIARGNHDALDDLPLLERLEVSNVVRVVERCETLRISTEAGDVALGVLGWPSRAYVAALAGGASKEGVEQVAADALRAVLRGIGDYLEQQTDCPAILLAHAMVRGSRVSTGQPLVGCDFELGLEDLALARASFYALGHVHMENVFDIAGAPAAYPGSPRRTAFGELERKGYYLLEFDGPRLLSFEHIETPATPMVQFEFTWASSSEGGVLFLDCGRQPTRQELEALKGAEVRIRYSVETDQRAAARPAVEELADTIRGCGAVNVKVEEVVEAKTRARTLEVAQAPTLADKLAALWRAQGFEPGDRRAELLGKAGQVEEESRAA